MTALGDATAMIMDFDITKVFHPVGQGLFSSATLSLSNSDGTIGYAWVYDCGTHSAQGLVKREIARFAGCVPALDLLVVSHFDADHVSGVSTLIGQVPTRRIMLPYMSLAQRLLLAFEQGFTGADELMDFYINPAAYLAAQATDPDIEFLFVPPSNPDASPGPPDPGRDPQPDDRGPDDSGPPRKRREGSLEDSVTQDHNPPRDIEEDLSAMRETQPGTGPMQSRISLLKQGGKIVVDLLWEFVPYNDPLPTPRHFKVFVDEVERSRSDLMSASSHARRESILDQLKKVYDRHLQGSDKRNRGSLFLFEGPIKATAPSILAQKWPSTSYYYPWRPLLPVGVYQGTSRFLMTGDGVLRKPAELSALERYFGQVRMGDILALQVMHHGSGKNWHPGLASQLAPGISVFCSDPNRRQPAHPDAEVVRDFLPYSPVLIDQHTGMSIHAIYRNSEHTPLD
jgi:hypothetical protein